MKWLRKIMILCPGENRIKIPYYTSSQCVADVTARQRLHCLAEQCFDISYFTFYMHFCMLLDWRVKEQKHARKNTSDYDIEITY